MGNTCNSMADSCQCMTKPTENCEVISLQLIKEKKKKEKEKNKKQKILTYPSLTSQ